MKTTRKFSLIALCTLPFVLAGIGYHLYSKANKDLKNIDITKGWGDEPEEEIPVQNDGL